MGLIKMQKKKNMKLSKKNWKVLLCLFSRKWEVVVCQEVCLEECQEVCLEECLTCPVWAVWAVWAVPHQALAVMMDQRLKKLIKRTSSWRYELDQLSRKERMERSIFYLFLRVQGKRLL